MKLHNIEKFSRPFTRWYIEWSLEQYMFNFNLMTLEIVSVSKKSIENASEILTVLVNDGKVYNLFQTEWKLNHLVKYEVTYKKRYN